MFNKLSKLLTTDISNFDIFGKKEIERLKKRCAYNIEKYIEAQKTLIKNHNERIRIWNMDWQERFDQLQKSNSKKDLFIGEQGDTIRSQQNLITRLRGDVKSREGKIEDLKNEINGQYGSISAMVEANNGNIDIIENFFNNVSLTMKNIKTELVGVHSVSERNLPEGPDPQKRPEKKNNNFIGDTDC